MSRGKKTPPAAPALPLGVKLAEVRPMTDREIESENWARGPVRPVVLVFADGTRVFASRDDGGSGPGCLFCRSPGGLPCVIRVAAEEVPKK
jgi:hypothetical protein